MATYASLNHPLNSTITLALQNRYVVFRTPQPLIDRPESQSLQKRLKLYTSPVLSNLTGGVSLCHAYLESSLVFVVLSEAPRDLQIINSSSTQQNLDIVETLSFINPISSIVCNKTIVTICTLGGDVLIFNLPTLTLIIKIQYPNSPSNAATPISISPHHLALTCPNEPNAIVFRDGVSPLTINNTIRKAHASAISLLALSKCGQVLASSSEKGNAVKLWKINGEVYGSCKNLTRGSFGNVGMLSLCFWETPEHGIEMVAGNSSNGTIHVWDDIISSSSSSSSSSRGETADSKKSKIKIKFQSADSNNKNFVVQFVDRRHLIALQMDGVVRQVRLNLPLTPGAGDQDNFKLIRVDDLNVFV